MKTWPLLLLSPLLLVGCVVTGVFLAFSVGVAVASPCFLTGDDPKWLTCNFGLELWEEGKKSSRIFQQWNLFCTSHKQRPTDCSLERTVVAPLLNLLGGSGENLGTGVTIHRHSTEDGTLRLLSAGWVDGRLDFDVVYSGGERMPVKMRLKSRFKEKPGQLALLDLDSFQAKDVVRTFVAQDVVAQEWRVPEYDYTVNVPLVIRGRRTAAEGRRDALMASLSANDRKAFDRFAASTCFDASLPQPLYAKLDALNAQLNSATEAKRAELLAQADAITTSYLRTLFEKCLTDAGMSPKGRQAVRDSRVRDMLIEAGLAPPAWPK